MVEAVEAFTIVLAVATLYGWRPAALGAAAGFGLLAGSILLLGPMLALVPIAGLQLTIGILLLLFGMGWLRKASLRAAGPIPLHDENAVFATETDRIGAAARRDRRLSWIAGLAALKAIVLEGLEVVFIVLAISAGRGLLLPAGIGAAAACVLVLTVGAMLRRPLSRVPENALKFGVGVMLSAFGTFWIGEALGIAWPGADLVLFPLAALFLIAGLIAAALARRAAVEGAA
jgi:uncharacterized membrane protein